MMIHIAIVAAWMLVQPGSSTAASTSVQNPPLRVQQPADWTKLNWDGDDARFTRARAEMDVLSRKGVLTSAKVEALRVQSTHDRLDAVKFFRWVYAAAKAVRSQPRIRVTAYPADGAFQEIAPPQSYEYARIRFIIGARVAGQRWAALGKRLLQRNPEDYEVTYACLWTRDAAKSAADKAECLRLARWLISRKPSQAAPHAALARVYSQCWEAHGLREDGEAAMAGYEKYLALAPPDAEWRKMAKLNVERIRSKMASKP